MKEHQAGGKAWQICSSFGWHGFNTSNLKGRESGCNLCCKTANGLRVEVFANTKTQRRHPHSYFVSQTVLHWQERPMPATIRKVYMQACFQLRQTQHTKISWTQIDDSSHNEHRSTGVAGQGQHEGKYFVQCPLFFHLRYQSLEGDTACQKDQWGALTEASSLHTEISADKHSPTGAHLGLVHKGCAHCHNTTDV